MKPQKLILSVIAAFVVAYYGWWILASGDWFYTHSRNAPNRAAILKIRDGIRVGDDYEGVLRIYWQHATTDLRIDSGSSKLWAVSMPFEMGATNWVLYLDFRDEKVSAIRVRTSDGPRPSAGPDDISG